jgi:hypothetical protein
VAERTVVTHLEHISAKLQVQTRAQVAVWAAARLDSGIADGTGDDARRASRVSR